MPTISIDTFFACSLMVAVVMAAAALSTQILTANMTDTKDLNEDDYLRALSEYIVFNTGTPANWGSSNSVLPVVFGLAKSGSLVPNELDIDKICRLNYQNAFSLTYSNILDSVKLTDVGLGFSMSQIMDISTILYSKTTLEDSTTYTFRIYVNQDGAPVTASLHCYIVASNFLSDIYNNTSTDGVSYVDIEIPNASNGTASLVVFARALHDARMTAYEVYSFNHLSAEPTPSNAFLNLNPLNYTLWLSSNSSSVIIERAYAFSYKYQFNLAPLSNSTYEIPAIVEKSPIILVITGSNDSSSFVNWTAYPQIPLDAGANFTDSECHAFSYVVSVNGNLYKLTVRLAGANQ